MTRKPMFFFLLFSAMFSRSPREDGLCAYCRVHVDAIPLTEPTRRCALVLKSSSKACTSAPCSSNIWPFSGRFWPFSGVSGPPPGARGRPPTDSGRVSSDFVQSGAILNDFRILKIWFSKFKKRIKKCQIGRNRTKLGWNRLEDVRARPGEARRPRKTAKTGPKTAKN